MAQANQATTRNKLVAAMTAGDFELLAPHLTAVELPAGQTLIEPEVRIGWAWFPETGVCSVVATSSDGRQAEVALIGCEGVVDTASIHGTDRTPLHCFMQVSGHGWRLRVDALRAAADSSPSLRALLLAYAQSMFIQVAQTALVNASHTIAQRLARWLLMSSDRMGGPEIRLTHERLSLMLGVRRAGVTVAINVLERSGLVDARRGVIVITDRTKLRAYAADSYGTAEGEYARLIGTAIAKHRDLQIVPRAASPAIAEPDKPSSPA